MQAAAFLYNGRKTKNTRSPPLRYTGEGKHPIKAGHGAECPEATYNRRKYFRFCAKHTIFAIVSV